MYIYTVCVCIYICIYVTSCDLIVMTLKTSGKKKVLCYLVKHATYRWTVWNIGVYCKTITFHD